MFLDKQSTYLEARSSALVLRSIRAQVGRSQKQLLWKLFLVDEFSSLSPVTGDVSRAAPMVNTLKRNAIKVQANWCVFWA